MIKQSIWLAVSILLVAAALAQADIPGPGPRPRPPVPQQAPTIALGSRNVELVVQVDEKAKQARLVIPVKFLTGANQPRGRADAGPVGNAVAGIALTCAVVSGGFWLVRKGKSKVLALVLTAGSLLVGGISQTLANLAPLPLDPKGTSGKLNLKAVTLPANIEMNGNLSLEIVDEGDKVKLIVGKDMIKSDNKKEEK